MVFFYVIGFILWLVLTIIVVNLGSNRKIGGGLAFLLCFLTTPIIGLIVVALSDKKVQNSESSSEYNESIIGIADELTKLSKLKDDGIINEDEFVTMKKKLLNQQVVNNAGPDSYSKITIRDLRNNKIETVSKSWWESWKKTYGEGTYEILDYHE